MFYNKNNNNMNQDKLKIKSDLIEKYQGKTVEYIESTISLLKIERFIYSRFFIFSFSLIFPLSIFLYKICAGQIMSPLSTGLIMLLVHFVLFETLITKVIFKDSELNRKNLKFSIESLTELVENKKTSGI